MAFPGEEVDEDFLIALAAAEAAAADTSKRRRLSTTSSTASSPTPATPEGPYLAALKGSHSSSWQQQQQETLTHKRPGGSKTLATSTGGSGGGGACFKCGDTTHWARDCPQSVPAGGGGGGAFGGGSGGAQVVSGACFKCGDTSHWARDCPQSVPASGGGGGGGGGVSGGGGGYVDAGVKVEDKACPCGAGTCLVLTSNTARNPGRKFYKCPMRQDNGGCSFFEWCDSPSPGPANVRSNTVFQSNTSVAEMLCPCGAGACLILTAKTGMNAGRQFYRCPDNQGGTACSFFKWCDEQQLRTAAPLQGSPQYQADVTSSGQNTSKKSSSSCFKCGQDNHWAKDCPNQSSDPLPAKVGKTFTSTSSPDACFKCGKTGHWSRDCPSTNCGSGSVASYAKSSSTFGSWNSHRY